MSLALHLNGITSKQQILNCFIPKVHFEAKRSAEVTHNHPEGIKGAQAVASAVFMARNSKTKDEIKKFIIETFSYDLERKIDDIRPDYKFDVSCQGSVPEAIIAFLESTDFENAIRLAISIGGDSDTIACIAGGIAQAYYKTIPENIIDNVINALPEDLVNIIEAFSKLNPGSLTKRFISIYRHVYNSMT